MPHSPGRLVGSGDKQTVCAAKLADPNDDADFGGLPAASLDGGENLCLLVDCKFAVFTIKNPPY